MITPFHFACFCEERLRSQFDILDKPLGSFIRILRRFSLTENRASLQFCPPTTEGEEATPHVTLGIQSVPQKDEKTAFNCQLFCPTQKLQKNFRLLLDSPQEAEHQILKVFEFLQKSFLSLGYTTAVPAPEKNSTLEMAQSLIKAAVQTSVPASTTDDPLTEDAKALTHGKKYLVEDAAKGDIVRMRTHDGKYVPDGELPANIRVIN